MSIGRLEGFSDGVMAVAITLLVLDIHVPDVKGRTSLGHALLAQWPTYAAYAISFVTIGIIWINHHVQLGRLGRATHGLLIANLLLLMTVSLIPFATSLMARYLKLPRGEHLAAAVYAAVMLAMALAFSLQNYYVYIRHPSLLKTEMSEPVRRATLRRTMTGVVPYAVALAFAFVSPYITLALTGLLAAFYALPFSNASDIQN